MRVNGTNESKFNGTLRLTKETHTVGYSSRPKSSLSDFKCTPWSQDDIFKRYSSIFINVFTVSLWRVIVSHDCQVSDHCKSGSIRWDDNHGMSFPRVWIGRIRATH